MSDASSFLAMLTEMGFEEGIAQIALEASGNDLDAALQVCLTLSDTQQPSPPAMELKVGSRIEAQYNVGTPEKVTRSGFWYTGSVKKKRWLATGAFSYDVLFDDGVNEDGIPAEYVRPEGSGAGDDVLPGYGGGAIGTPADSPPEGFEVYVKTDYLAQMLRESADGTTPVRLLRASWLIKKGRTRRPLPYRQNTEQQEPQAFADAPLIEACLEQVAAAAADTEWMIYPGVVVMSYCWHSPMHPDPNGSLLEKLSHILEWYYSERVQQGWADPDFCVFMDFMSLYQGKRTAPQLAAFNLALDRMDEWYAHQGTVTMCIRKVPQDWVVERTYDSRGWCVFEESASSLSKPSHMKLDAGLFATRYAGDVTSKSGEELRAQAEGMRAVGGAHGGGVLKALAQDFCHPPRTPASFGQLLHRCHFSKESDRKVVHDLFAKVTRAVLGSIERLEFTYVDWTVADFTELGRALRMCHGLKKLTLYMCGMDDAGAAACFDQLGAGDLPQVTTLWWALNHIGAQGKQALASAVERGAFAPSCTIQGQE